VGDALWSRFTGGREGVLWYYSALAGDAFTFESPVVEELRATARMLVQHVVKLETEPPPE
jgi:hypothetical protein